MRGLTDPMLRRVLRARDRLHSEFAEELTAEALAATAGLSRWHFQRCFRAAFGASPHEYLSRLRLQRAKELLARGGAVTEVCMAVGFSSLGTFSTWFTRGAGASPRRWQRAARRVLPVPERLPLLWIPCCFLARYAPSTFREVDPAGGVVRASLQEGPPPP
jgi:AraC-like DNA-binding protein